ncbi:MAG TPA: hypothetical protein VF184_11230 [Phycisphaeraceae bacterium]
MAATAAASLGLASAAWAETITEYFNGYGESTVDLSGLGAAGDGWSTGWIDNTNPDYVPGTQLTYTAAGYSNAGNESGPDDGAAVYGGGTAGSIVRRGVGEFPGLGGTIWVSALVRISEANGEVLLWLGGSSANNYIAIRTGQVAFRYNGASQTGAAVATNQTHLMLAKIQVNVDGDNDTIEYWFDPDLSGGEAGLGAAVFSGSGQHVFGQTTVEGETVLLDMSGIRLSFAGAGSTIDAIRISNDADGFLKVTSAIPEPATVGLSAAGALTLLMHRRR